MKYKLMIFFSFIAITLSAQDKGFKDFLKKENKDFQNFVKQQNSQWQDFVDLDSKKYKEFVKSVMNKWGKDAQFSDKKKWVRYGDKQKTRVVTDFEKGNLKIEALGKKGETKKQLLNKVQKVVKEVLSEKANPGDKSTILKNQLIEKITPNKIKDKYIKIASVKAPSGKEITKLIINIPFKKNYLKIRAKRVIPIVKKYAAKYNIAPKLIMAIIHTESAFNPRARSSFRLSNGKTGHAYGLMQLVPYSGGKQAYNYLGRNGIPSRRYLYDEKNNIRLGTTYLYLLSKNYFSKVIDNIKKKYLIISAYNTGPGNVTRILSNSNSLLHAVKRVNVMDRKKLYSHLIKNLPYKETRDYLQKVVERESFY